MKRVIVYCGQQYCNLTGNRIEEDKLFLRVFDGDELIGIFDIAAVDMAYVSEKKEVDVK